MDLSSVNYRDRVIKCGALFTCSESPVIHLPPSSMGQKAWSWQVCNGRTEWAYILLLELTMELAGMLLGV